MGIDTEAARGYKPGTAIAAGGQKPDEPGGHAAAPPGSVTEVSLSPSTRVLGHDELDPTADSAALLEDLRRADARVKLSESKAKARKFISDMERVDDMTLGEILKLIKSAPLEDIKRLLARAQA